MAHKKSIASKPMALKKDGKIWGSGHPKSNLIDRADSTQTHHAISEILDNILQNYLSSIDKFGDDAPGELIVEITAQDLDDEIHGMITIDENSGGVSNEKMEAFVTPGESSWDETEDAVGTWGSGSKVALAHLGRWNRVHTRYYGEQQKNFELGSSDDIDPELPKDSDEPKNWYCEKNTYWYVKEMETEHTIEEGRTETVIRRVTKNARNFFCDDDTYHNGFTQLKKIFEAKIRAIRDREKEVTITLLNDMTSDEELTEISLAEFEENSWYSGDFDSYRNMLPIGIFWPARTLKYRLKADERTPELLMDILVGPAEDTVKRKGFMMWGNNRLFAEWHEALSSIDSAKSNWGIPKGYKAYSIGGGSGTGSWLCFVKFTSTNPRAIPWDGPIKWGYHEGNQIYEREIQEVLARVVTSYLAQSSTLSKASGIFMQNQLLTPKDAQ